METLCVLEACEHIPAEAKILQDKEGLIYLHMEGQQPSLLSQSAKNFVSIWEMSSGKKLSDEVKEAIDMHFDSPYMKQQQKQTSDLDGFYSSRDTFIKEQLGKREEYEEGGQKALTSDMLLLAVESLEGGSPMLSLRGIGMIIQEIGFANFYTTVCSDPRTRKKVGQLFRTLFGPE